MAKYVDGFLLPVPRRKLEVYRRIARAAGKVWIEHGALQYVECAGADLKTRWGTPFPARAKLKPGETAIFSWIVYRSKAHRDRVNAKVMKDPRIAKMMEPTAMPFDVKRMSYGGFDVIVER